MVLKSSTYGLEFRMACQDFAAQHAGRMLWRSVCSTRESSLVSFYRPDLLVRPDAFAKTVLPVCLCAPDERKLCDVFLQSCDYRLDMRIS